MSNSFLQLFKGPDGKIKELNLEDGRLSFATDTKKIYLDCDFTDSNGKTLQDRLAFGGSSGIFYGEKEFTPDESTYTFELGDLDTTEEIPQRDDLILNSDGCFYRVMAVVESHLDDDGITIIPLQIKTDKLTVAGSGGGGGEGGGGLVAKKVDGQKRYWSAADGELLVQYCVVSREFEASVDMQIIIRGNTVATVYSVPQSLTDPATVNLWPYLNYFNTNSTTDISLRFTDSYGNQKTINYNSYFTYVDMHINVQSTQLGQKTSPNIIVPLYLFGPPYSAMAERYVCYRLTRPDNTVPEELDISEKTVANGNAYNLQLTLGQYAGEGDYYLDVWMKGKMSADDTEYIYSEEKHLTFAYIPPDSQTPYITVAWENNSYVARKSGVLTYMVAYHKTESSTVTVYIYKDGSNTPCASRDELVIHGEPNSFIYRFTEPGSYTAKVVWANNDTVFGQTRMPAIVEPATNITVPTTYMSGLQVNLSAQGRSNNELARNTWTSSVNNIDVNCTLSNFNWSTNGWFADENGDGYLHLTNGARLTVNFPLYSTTYTTGNKDPMRNGKAIEIDFRLSNVRDANAILMSAFSRKDNGIINNGIVCQGEKICINTAGKRNYYSQLEEMNLKDEERASTAGLRAYLTEDRRIHIAFDIEGSDTTDYYNGQKIKPMIYTFVDGVISGLTQVDLNDTIGDANPEVPSFLTINSDQADIDIYNIRIYEGFLTESVIRNNFIADYSDDSIQERLTEANDLLDSDNKIDFDKVKESAHIPYMVLMDLGATDSKKGEAAYDQTDNNSHLPTSKKDFRGGKMYFVDPFDPTPDGKYQIGTAEEPVDVVMYGQGTSSMAYPVKNIRIRLKNQKYSLKYSPDNGQTYANFPGVRIFTLKADYMDSSMAHNTGTGNILSALYDTPGVKLKTPAQDYFSSRTITNNIVGFPMLCFFQRYTDEPGTKPEYIGRYNFNLDKAEADLFGFASVREEGKNFGVLTTEMMQNGKVVYAGDLKNGYAAVAAKNETSFSPDTVDYYYRPIINNPSTVPARGGYPGIGTPQGYNTILDLRDDAVKISRDGSILTYEPSEQELALFDKIDREEPISQEELSGIGLNNRVALTELYNKYKVQLAATAQNITQENVLDAINAFNSALSNFSVGSMTLLSAHGTADQKTGKQLAAQAKYGPVYQLMAGPGTVQCWEFLNNSYDLCGFRSHWNELSDYNHLDAEKGMPFDYWRQAFESRYPEFEQNDVESDKRSFAAFINWVADTDQSKVREVKDQVELVVPYEAEDGTVYTHDTPEYRLAKFKTEASEHMMIPFVAFYYVVTETLLAIDNRGKNMMMCCFDADNDAGTGHWFPIFYDMDTMLGVNNYGTLKYQYYAEDTDTQTFNANAAYYNESGILEENYSTLWCNFRMAFQQEIKEMYIALHKGQLNYNGLVSWYNDRQADAFQMVEINKDHEYKYIRPLTTPLPVTEDGEIKIKTYNGTNAAQGTRSLHRDYWLNHRFAFLTSKYPDMRNTSSADIYYRAYFAGESSVPANMHYSFQSSSVQYANYSYGTNAQAPVVKVRPGEIVDGPPIANLKNTDQECYLFNLGNIFDIGDMSTKYPGIFQVSRPIKLTKLKIGNSTVGYTNPQLNNEAFLTSLRNLPLLRELDVTNTSLVGSVDLTTNQYITSILAGGSRVTDFSFAKGGSLNKLVLPATYEKLILLYNTFSTFTDYQSNSEQEKHLIFEKIGNLSYLGIEACPNMDVKNLLKEIIRVKKADIVYYTVGANEQLIEHHTNLDAGLETTNTYDKLFTAVRLPDLNIDLYDDDTTDVTLNNGYISDIPILLYLSKVRQGYESDYSTRVLKQKTNNQYIGGTITIHNPTHPVDEYSLSAAYGQLFPNLKIQWTNSTGNLHGYHLNFYDDNGYQITVDPQNNELINSTVFGLNDLAALNVTNYIRDHVGIPVIVQTANGQYDQTFRGWTLDNPKHTNDEVELHQWLNEGIEVIYDDQGHVTRVINNLKTTLTPEDFIGENQDYNLYPIREDVIRYHNVTFHRYKEGSQQAINDPEHDIIPVYALNRETGQYEYMNTQSVMWGTKAVMPEDEPTNMVLNNDGTTTVYPFYKYTYDAANLVIRAPLDNYPIFRDGTDNEAGLLALDAKDSPSPDSFFEVSAVENLPNSIGSGLSNGVCLTLKTGILAPAITVPKTVNGKNVYQLKIPRKVEMSKLKRIYFETGSPIRVISSDLAANENHNAVAHNRILEYLDVTNVNLLMISAYTFAYTPNLKLINNYLPPTISLIEQYAFAQKTTLGSSININALPSNLTEIGSYAFENCTSITSINLGAASGVLSRINSYAFNGCTNMYASSDENSDIIRALQIVGAYAFNGCSNLSLYNNTSEEEVRDLNLRFIGKYAFANCPNIGFRADISRVTTIEDGAFMNCESVGISQIPNNLTVLGARVFENCTLPRANGGMLYFNNKKIAAWSTSVSGTEIVQTGLHPDAFGGMKDTFRISYVFVVFGGSPDNGDPPGILDATTAPWNGYMNEGIPMYYRHKNADNTYSYYAANDENLPASGNEPVIKWGLDGHTDERWISFGG